MKNFRDKWVGATEGNLEKVFSILHALGQVIVFVDEADQMTGKRGGGDGDSGLSGRVYGMLAKEMSDTQEPRARSSGSSPPAAPTSLEVDLKRQGRLDVHIPLFPPGDAEGRASSSPRWRASSSCRSSPRSCRRCPTTTSSAATRWRGSWCARLRVYEAAKDAEERGQGKARPLRDMHRPRRSPDFRPSAHVERLELMDLLAVKECTDTRFLPERFRKLSLAEVNARIEQLKLATGE